MTNLSASLLLSLLLLPTSAPAQLQPVDSSSTAGFSKIKFKEKKGPAAEPPDTPPNLPTLKSLRRLSETAVQVDRNAADPITPAEWEAAIDAAAKAMIEKLKKPHSSYLDRNDLQALQQRMGGPMPPGIGAELSPDKTGAKVEGVIPDSPAEAAGLQEGDIITGVNDVSMAGKKLDEIIPLIRGPRGTPVRLTIQRGGRSLTITATRNEYKTFESFEKMVAEDIGYVFLNSFNCAKKLLGECLDGTHTRVFASIKALRAKGARKLIIDVRFKP